VEALSAVETQHFGRVPVRRRDCPLCGRCNEELPPSPYSQGPWRIKDCSGCGFVYIDRAPEYEVQSEAMSWERTTKVEEQRRADIRPMSYKASKRTRFRLHILPRRTMLGYIARRLAGGNVLDLGCGGEGHALAGFPPSFTPFGIEISAQAAATADSAFRSRGGRVINAPSVEGIKAFPENFFAAASLRGYLEHEAEPLPVLRNLHRVLPPGGFAVVKVPNYASLNRRVMGARWCGFRYPDHLNYFTPRTLALMAAKAGFKTRFGPTGALPTSDNMWAVLTKSAR
jgi:SAM-dependent methyltransferase